VRYKKFATILDEADLKKKKNCMHYYYEIQDRFTYNHRTFQKS